MEKLARDDVNVLAAAITWTLYTPLYKVSPPGFSATDTSNLEAVFQSLCKMIHGEPREITIDKQCLRTEAAVVVDCDVSIQHLITCLQVFHAEIGHSWFEVQAVTGLPIDVLKSLHHRLSLLRKT